MKASNFRIVPLSTEVAEAARAKAREGASDHTVVIADSPTGYPCRHCLQWAQPGERVVLFPYATIPSGRPYSESGPIFVHEQSCDRYSSVEKYPADFRQHRVMRAYDTNQDMIDAVVVGDDAAEIIIEKLFQNPAAVFLQARSVTRGCYTFGIERA